MTYEQSQAVRRLVLGIAVLGAAISMAFYFDFSNNEAEKLAQSAGPNPAPLPFVRDPADYTPVERMAENVTALANAALQQVEKTSDTSNWMVFVPSDGTNYARSVWVVQTPSVCIYAISAQGGNSQVVLSRKKLPAGKGC